MPPSPMRPAMWPAVTMTSESLRRGSVRTSMRWRRASTRWPTGWAPSSGPGAGCCPTSGTRCAHRWRRWRRTSKALEDGVATLDAGTAELPRSQTWPLARLSEDIGTVSRTEEGQVRLDRRTVHPESVISAAVDSVTEADGTKGVRLVTDVASGLPELSLDPERVGQVLANLLDNALRHTPAGGTVRISATRRPGGVALSVADTGEGIPAEHLAHIFERFYPVDAARDRAHGGSGIGLAIARALVEAHGGQLTATSPGPGQGSTFRVFLPRG